MDKVIDLSHEEARTFFLKSNSYFNNQIPSYISFNQILDGLSAVITDNYITSCKNRAPGKSFDDVNYNLLTNKDGRFAWRPLEIIHPLIYVSLVNEICHPDNWLFIQNRFSEFAESSVECCSIPVISDDDQTDTASQIRSWWVRVEQQSLIHSLTYSHLLHTDVTDCYGSLYTHSICWALHGKKQCKEKEKYPRLLGETIDFLIRAGRSRQTNGISQGSILMDLIAEIVLGYLDQEITVGLHGLPELKNYHILRYRDDYRIFANSDEDAETILKTISEAIRPVGMRLGMQKTQLKNNLVEGAIKPDKLAGIDLQDLGTANAATIQKQLLRLHSFGQRFPNSGALKRLVGDLHDSVFKNQGEFSTLGEDELEVLVAITADIGFVSPATIPVAAGILSCLLSCFSTNKNKEEVWKKVHEKMERLPHNGYLEIWLQRVAKPNGFPFDSHENICRIVDKEEIPLWENEWISCDEIIDLIEVSKIVDESKLSEIDKVIQPEEVALFKQNAWLY